MRLGEMLVAQGYVTQEQVDAALERQRREGGRLGANLVAQGVLTVEVLLATVKNQQEAEGATHIIRRTFESWKTIYGANHPHTNRARYNLASACLAAGNTAEAAELTEAAELADAAFAAHRLALGASRERTPEAADLVGAAPIAGSGKPEKPESSPINITAAEIDQVWAKAHRAGGDNDKGGFRKDQCGAWIKRSDYGNRESLFGWEIGRIAPNSQDGSDAISNLRPLHWRNASNSGGRLVCMITSKGNKNVAA